MDGGCRDPDRSAHDVPPQEARSAPCQTRSKRSAPRCPSACNVIAARSAASRKVNVAGHSYASAISVPAFASRDQRRSVLQPAPSAGSHAVAVGAIASRTADGLERSTPNSASPKPIAVAGYSRRRTTPRGATVTVAPHFVHRYRRTPMLRSDGGWPTASGPRCWRLRSPWPCICTRPPTGRLGALHFGQHAGRNVSRAALFARRLPSADSSSIVWSLRPIVWLRSPTSGGIAVPRSSPLWPPCVRAPSSDPRATSTRRSRPDDQAHVRAPTRRPRPAPTRLARHEAQVSPTRRQDRRGCVMGRTNRPALSHREGGARWPPYAATSPSGNTCSTSGRG